MEKGAWPAVGAFVMAFVMLVPLNFANYAYFLTDMKLRNRIFLVAAAVMMWFLKFYWIVALIGFALLVFVLVDQILKYRKEVASGVRRLAPAAAAVRLADVSPADISEKVKKLEDTFRD